MTIARAKCLDGCPNDRPANQVCCLDHWKTVPRALKVEIWAAQKEATTGRGRTSNGKATPRWVAAFRAIVTWLLEEQKAP
jgi:hypothetical protein